MFLASATLHHFCPEEKGVNECKLCGFKLIVFQSVANVTSRNSIVTKFNAGFLPALGECIHQPSTPFRCTNSVCGGIIHFHSFIHLFIPSFTHNLNDYCKTIQLRFAFIHSLVRLRIYSPFTVSYISENPRRMLLGLLLASYNFLSVFISSYSRENIQIFEIEFFLGIKTRFCAQH